MKKLLTGLIALITLSFSANAQRTPGAPPKQHSLKESRHTFPERKKDRIKAHRLHMQRKMHRHHRMIRQINLSDNQKQQAKLYKENYKKQLLELNKNENITVKEFRNKKLVLHKEQKAKIQSLLTPEQKNKLELLKAEQRTKAEEHFTAKLYRMKSKLSLTDNQVAKMKAQREEMMTKLKALKEDDKMDRVIKKEKLMALKSQMKEGSKKIFTEEQLNKLEEMKKGRMEKKAVK